MARAHDDRTAFRCSVAPENSAAKLKLGRRHYDVSVLDTSRAGFSVRVPNRVSELLEKKQSAVLHFAAEQWEVQLESRYRDSGESTILGFARMRELTKIKTPSSWGLSLTPRVHASQDPTFLVFLIVAFLVAAVCLPGLGDNLGTAPKVRSLLRSVMGRML